MAEKSDDDGYDYAYLNDLSDEELAEMQQQLESEQGGGEGTSFDSPLAPKKDSWLVFAREINKDKDSTKVANLDNTDLVLVRGNKRLANFCKYIYQGGNSTLEDYFNARAEILLATSMSKKAKFLELLVTQIKKQMNLKPPMIKKRTLFGGVNEVPVEQ